MHENQGGRAHPDANKNLQRHDIDRSMVPFEIVQSLTICPVNIIEVLGFKVYFVTMDPTDENLPSLLAEILVTFSWLDVKGGGVPKYRPGHLTPNL